MKALGTNAVEREREPVIPVDRQRLLVGHGAECMVKARGSGGHATSGGTDLHLPFGLFQSRVPHLSLSAAARSTPFTFITPGAIIGDSNPVEVLFTLIVVLRTVLQVPSEFFLKSSHVSMTVGFGAHAAPKIAITAVASARIVRIPFRQPGSRSLELLFAARLAPCRN